MIFMEKRYALRDEQWERLEALGLPGQSGHVGVTAKDNRRFVEAVLYRLRAGIPWRDLPACFGNLAPCVRALPALEQTRRVAQSI